MNPRNRPFSEAIIKPWSQKGILIAAKVNSKLGFCSEAPNFGPLSQLLVLMLNFFCKVTTMVDPYTNETVIVGTEMRQNPIYTQVYVVWSKLILTDLVPYFVIMVLNSFIVVKIVKSSRFRAKILRNRNERSLEVSFHY